MQRFCLVLLLLAAGALGLSEFEALLELKKGIENDPSGKVMASWDSKSVSSETCPHNWYGITCSDGHVTSINLEDLGLEGNFSFPAIAGLRGLLNISIPDNSFTGTITKIDSLESLRYLDLSHNMFYGVLPPGIADLRNLEHLDLSSNRFEGAIPSGFRNLERLKHLDLQANGFSGDIMALLSVLGRVKYADISKNRFSGSLDLARGRSGFVESITHFNVSNNSLLGRLFAHDGMPFFDSLESFDASNNQLEGPVPQFNFMLSLKILRLRGNRLSGSLPGGLFEGSSMVLSELDLSHNQLEGPIQSITSTTLKKLNLSSNKLSGSIPLRTGNCAVIDLSNNKLSGNLSRIQTWGNSVEVIQLSSNSLSGTLPNQTSQFLRLTSLKVSNNSLHGGLPSVLGAYPELTDIDLSLNELSGFLVSNLFTSAKLVSLDLSGNKFSGSIPLQDVQGGATAQNFSLMNLNLSHNSLSGFVPEQLSMFRYLMYLDLSNNKFEGSIPSGIPGDLKEFNVAYNNLSGVVPKQLRQFSDSAFHPGNSLLILPGSPSSSGNAPDLTSGEHGSHKKSAKAGLIAGSICGAAVVSLLCGLIYYVFWKQRQDSSQKGKGGVRQGSHSIPHSSESASEDRMPAVQKSPGQGSENISSIVKGPNDLVDPASVGKDEPSSPPTSIISSSAPSPSRSRLYYGSPGRVKVHTPDKLAGELHLFDSSVQFTAEELSLAPAEAIGRSCHGTLYRATLDSGYVLAVKWLREGIAKGKKEFAREVRKLGSIKHRNLVSLLAYYWGPKEHEKLIVSEYINAHCLAHYLQQETLQMKLPPLSLNERLRIALDVAGCLSYLHNERAIPHGNLKSTNILLEAPNFDARLTDYSLHRILTPSATAEQVLNAAALGYRPPEFASSSKPCPSLKSDVYAFGVVLMELLTGKSSGEIVSGDPGVVDLTDWVRLLAGGNRSAECFDRSILGRSGEQDPSRVLNNVLQVALKCILPASERPDIKSVFEELSVIVSDRPLEGT